MILHDYLTISQRQVYPYYCTTTVSDIDFAKAHTDSTLTLVTSDIRSRESLLPTWITILLYLVLVLASSFSLDSMSPALAPGMQLTVVAGVANLTFLRTESPITRVCFSEGASPSGENLLETRVGGSLIVGFLRVALCPLRTVTQPPWAPGCTGQVGGLLAEAKLCATANRGSKLRSRASKSLSLASIATNTLHLLHVPLLLREAEE